MRVKCDLVVHKWAVSGGGGVKPRPTRGAVAVGRPLAAKRTTMTDENDVTAAQPQLSVMTLKDGAPKVYKLIDNIEQLFSKYVPDGKLTVRLKEGVEIQISKADPSQASLLHKFLKAIATGQPFPKLYSHGGMLKLRDLKPAQKQMHITVRADYPHTTGFPPNLETLTISCDYDRIDPRWLKLKRLTRLDLSANNILQTRLSALKLDQLVSLKVLNLSRNQLTSLPVEVWASLPTSLRSLDLSQNRLSQLPPLLMRLHQLETLNLASNQLAELPQTMGDLVRLKQLFLEANRLSNLPYSIRRLSLQQLSLGGNPFSIRWPISLAPAPQPLTLLELAGLTVLRQRVDLSLLPWSLRLLVSASEHLFSRCPACRRVYAVSQGPYYLFKMVSVRLLAETISYGAGLPTHLMLMAVVCSRGCAG